MSQAAAFIGDILAWVRDNWSNVIAVCTFIFSGITAHYVFLKGRIDYLEAKHSRQERLKGAEQSRVRQIKSAVHEIANDPSSMSSLESFCNRWLLHPLYWIIDSELKIAAKNYAYHLQLMNEFEQYFEAQGPVYWLQVKVLRHFRMKWFKKIPKR